MGRRGSLTTSEKLASKNPAQRRAGQKEAAKQTASARAKTVSKAKSIASRGYRGTVSPSEVEGPTQTQIQEAKVKETTISTKAEPTATVTTPIATKVALQQQVVYSQTQLPSAFGRAEAKVAKYTTQPIARGLGKVGVTKERVAGFTTRIFGAGMVKGFRERRGMEKLDTLDRVEKFQRGMVEGAAKGLQEQPLKTAAVGAAFYAFPAVTGAIGVGAAKLAPAAYLAAAPKVAVAAKIGGAALLTKYGVSRYQTAKSIEDLSERGKFVGRTLATEIIPAGIGAVKGGRAATPLRQRAAFEATIRTKYTPAQQKAISKAVALGRTAKVDPKVRKAPIEQVLPRKEAQITREFLAKEKGVLYGSVAQKAQLKPSIVKQMRPSGDIDIAMKSPQMAAVKYATAIYKGTGVKPTIPMKALARGGVWGPTQEASVFVGGKAVTFHTPQSMVTTPFYTGKTRVTPAGVRIMAIEEQLTRKVAGAYLMGRAKDVPDVRDISRSLKGELGKQRGIFKTPTKGYEIISKLEPLPTPKPVIAKAPTTYPSYPKATITPVYPTTKRVRGYAYPRPDLSYPVPIPSAPYAPSRYVRPPSYPTPVAPSYPVTPTEPTPPYPTSPTEPVYPTYPEEPAYPGYPREPTPSYPPPTYTPPRGPPPRAPPVWRDLDPRIFTPKVRTRKGVALYGTYKPSLAGIVMARELKEYIPKAPKAVTGLFVRKVVKRKKKRKKKR